MPHILTLSCADRPGIVAAIAGALARCGGNILEAQQFDDLETGRFFMRVAVDLSEGDVEIARAALTEAAAPFAIEFALKDQTQRKRVLILASAFDHCLSDLLYRTRNGELRAEIVGIASNHPREQLEGAMIGATPFHHLPIDRADRQAQEAQLRALIAQTEPDLIVLARYMQILSDEFAASVAGRCINIHHSFLPGFKGAKPYTQAHARGVKLIGATAHFVTAELDEGPIIEQDVERISHNDTPADLIRKGRDVERRVLARAVHWFLEDRVLINGAKTVVFRD